MAFVNNKIVRSTFTLHEEGDHDKLEVVYTNLWKKSAHFKVVSLFSPPKEVPNLYEITNLSQNRNAKNRSTKAIDRSVHNLLDFSGLFQIPSEPTFLTFGGYTSSPDLILVYANFNF
ncbi:hypothetical protein NPIL_376681 [Nephila pilipes]|uniref:Uncharacterized protein n=1 Tax=Nephila pilipes TaxID=299642 RepID=A0A8X6QDZ8_NEPPI|nr:hypothetical protein NPIL_376681 [Nephila pilipes]